MLLETALADFSDEASLPVSGPLGPPSAVPFIWEEAPGRPKKLEKHVINKPMVQQDNELHLHEETADRMFAGRKQPTTTPRSDSGNYVRPGSTPFKWEASPGKPAMLHETPVSSPGSPQLPPPPALRAINVSHSPFSPKSHHERIVGKVRSIISGRVPSSVAQCTGASFQQHLNKMDRKSDKLGYSSSSNFSFSSGDEHQGDCTDSSYTSSGSGRDINGDNYSPVSTLDRPPSPDSPEIHISPRFEAERHAARVNVKQGSQLAQVLVSLSDMTEELPSVVEEEEDEIFHSIVIARPELLHPVDYRSQHRSGNLSVSGSQDVHQSLPSLAGKPKSGPITRLSRTSTAHGISKVNWADDLDFDDRPEEVEHFEALDESLWAYSPVSSTFVFSENDKRGSNPASPQTGNTTFASATPASDSPDSLKHGSSLVRKNITRSMSSKPGFGGKSSADGAVPYSGHIGVDNRYHFEVNDVEYQSHARSMRRPFSCLPFRQLVKVFSSSSARQISFEQRLSPSMRKRI